MDVPEKTCLERNESRADRNFGPHVVRSHSRQLKRSLRNLKKEGFRHVWVLSPEEIENVEITRQPLWNNRKFDVGPFDIIGDIHGCADELETLLGVLGYENNGDNWHHPEKRRVIFLGDLVDRGPRVVGVLRIVMAMCESENALCVPGNHDVKLLRHLSGKKVNIAHGLQETLDQFAAIPEAERAEFEKRVAKFLDGLISHYVLDGGNLVVAHAGLKAELQGRASGAVRAFALYGETTGESDEFGLPIRSDWAREYRGNAAVVYGHTPIPKIEWLNNTLNIDTGCVFGGSLTALRWPERDTVSVPASREYSAPTKPFLLDKNSSAQHIHDDILDIADVTGKRIIHTRLMNNVTVREENSIAALEVMSRFAADPKWLITLPPTMSPCATTIWKTRSNIPRKPSIISAKTKSKKWSAKKSTWVRARLVIIGKNAAAIQKRFGIREEKNGIILTRTGRPFFNDSNLELQLLQRLQNAILGAGLWDELGSDWLCLDCELMPWSVKAQELLQRQYAPVAAASQAALGATLGVLQEAFDNGAEVGELLQENRARLQMAQQYGTAYRGYVWDVNGIEDLQLAPFHILASEGKVHTAQNHLWHMETIAKICAQDEQVLLATNYRVVNLEDETETQNAIEWWEEMTARGGEGMVVKPLEFISRNAKGFAATGHKMSRARISTNYLWARVLPA